MKEPLLALVGEVAARQRTWRGRQDRPLVSFSSFHSRKRSRSPWTTNNNKQGCTGCDGCPQTQTHRTEEREHRGALARSAVLLARCSMHGKMIFWADLDLLSSQVLYSQPTGIHRFSFFRQPQVENMDPRCHGPYRWPPRRETQRTWPCMRATIFYRSTLLSNVIKLLCFCRFDPAHEVVLCL